MAWTLLSPFAQNTVVIMNLLRKEIIMDSFILFMMETSLNMFFHYSPVIVVAARITGVILYCFVGYCIVVGFNKIKNHLKARKSSNN